MRQVYVAGPHMTIHRHDTTPDVMAQVLRCGDQVLLLCADCVDEVAEAMA